MKLLIIGSKGFTGRNLSEYFTDATVVRMFHNIAKCHNLYGKLLYFGSGAEYDKRYPICSVSEDDLDCVGSYVITSNCSGFIPASMYGQAKYIIGREIEAGIFNSENIYNLRIFGLFGRYENWKSTFISGACCKAMNNLPITIRKDVFFDYLYINDFCKMIDMFIQIDEPEYRTYNITSGRRIKLTELADIIKKVSDKDVPVVVCEQGLANEYTASNKRFINQIGGYEFISYEDSISDLYKWYVNHRNEIDLKSLLYS